MTFRHCQRCGTIVAAGKSGFTEFYRPYLVDYCRQLEREYIPRDEYPPLTNDWQRLGIREAINTPDQRPT